MQTQKLGTISTVMFTDTDGFTKVIYHSTCVIRWNDEKIILDSGGWKTNTTKARINQTSNQFRLGLSVYQKKGTWFVMREKINGIFDFENAVLFSDGMELSRSLTH